MRILVLLCACLTSGQGLAQCPGQELACGIELHGEGAPRLTGACGHEAWRGYLTFGLKETFADHNDDGWHETVLELDLAPSGACGCATFRVYFQGTPVSTSVNIGDSPTNDGHGGDAGSTWFDAEVHVFHSTLSVYSLDQQDPGVGNRKVFSLAALPVADKTLELEICNQTFGFAIAPEGPDEDALNGFLDASVSRHLFTIEQPRTEPTPPTVAEVPDARVAADSRIYAAFNRVIHRWNGRPAYKRFGTGVRRVEVFLTP